MPFAGCFKRSMGEKFIVAEMKMSHIYSPPTPRLQAEGCDLVVPIP